jgi:uncharacterized membrane protein YedE/YeeE
MDDAVFSAISFPYSSSLLGGALIGASAAVLLLLNGRIAGISGIVGALFQKPDARFFTNLAFVAGLVLGPIGYLIMFGAWPTVRIETSTALLILAGLIVGFGTRMGSGCTSGHGVVGLARLSPRSMAAVATFLAMAMLTVFLMRIGGVA